MDNLRLILILFGIGVIVGIYIWGKAQSRGVIKKRTINSTGNFKNKNETFFSEESNQEENFSSEFANLNNFLSGTKSGHNSESIDDYDELPSIDSSVNAEDNTTADLNETEGNQEIIEILPEDIITLHIMATDGALFTGKEIEHSLSDLGFQFGNMGIFHYYVLDTNTPLISLANMFEPGSFNIKSMDSFSTGGLSMFIRLPTPVGATTAFESMLNKAYDLADKLNGEICGSDRNPFNEQVLDGIYQQLQYYD